MWCGLYHNKVMSLKSKKTHAGKLVQSTRDDKQKKDVTAHTVGRGTLLEGRVVQARLLSPRGDRCWGQVLLGGRCACSQTVRFRWQSTGKIYYGGSIFTLKLCLSFTSFPPLKGNSLLRSSGTSRKWASSGFQMIWKEKKKSDSQLVPQQKNGNGFSAEST